MEYQAITNGKYISHHGVKGMRWGRRKDGGPQGYLGTYPKGNMKNISRSVINSSLSKLLNQVGIISL